jgi:hypothetical protein
MLQSSKAVLPYEPAYSGHWEADKRRRETRDWLRQRARECAFYREAPSVVPELEKETEHA